jgi:hypothetical protein
MKERVIDKAEEGKIVDKRVNQENKEEVKKVEEVRKIKEANKVEENEKVEKPEEVEEVNKVGKLEKEKTFEEDGEVDEEDKKEEEFLKSLEEKEKCLSLEVKDLNKKIKMLKVVLDTRVEPEGKYKIVVRKTENDNDEANIGRMRFKKHQHYTKETNFMKNASSKEIKEENDVSIEQKRDNSVEYFIKKFGKLTMISNKKAKLISERIENFMFGNCKFIIAKKYMGMVKNVIENIKLVKLFEITEKYLHKSSFPIDAFTKDKGYFKLKCKEFERDSREIRRNRP